MSSWTLEKELDESNEHEIKAFSKHCSIPILRKKPQLLIFGSYS